MSAFSFPTEVVSEGSVKILVPELRAFSSKPSDYAPSKAPVFYNPVMELNRDLAVLMVQAFQRAVGRDLSICEPLAGCGVRGVRMAREVEGIERVVINDINDEAYGLARFNVEKNGLLGRVSVENEDANFLLGRFGAPKKRFDYVDIDPFGSPIPFVDSSLRALRSGGLLAMTATDLTALCGVYPRVCVRRYGGKPLRTEYCHELAVRLLAGALARAAAKYDVGVRVLFSYSSEHYVRVYAVVGHGAERADVAIGSMGCVHHCSSCLYREVVKGMFQGERVCPECGKRMAIAGPLWLGEVADEGFVESLEMEARGRSYRWKKSIRALLALVRAEADAPISYYVVDVVCNKLGLPVPSVKRVVERLRTGGYKAWLTHFHPRGFRTNAAARAVGEAVTACASTS
jgi:tRNA (guanine26-N2/guanine27-N2)-dimethyltransferase